jgi:hypothetical protein
MAIRLSRSPLRASPALARAVRLSDGRLIRTAAWPFVGGGLTVSVAMPATRGEQDGAPAAANALDPVAPALPDPA